MGQSFSFYRLFFAIWEIVVLEQIKVKIWCNFSANKAMAIFCLWPKSSRFRQATVTFHILRLAMGPWLMLENHFLHRNCDQSRIIWPESSANNVLLATGKKWSLQVPTQFVTRLLFIIHLSAIVSTMLNPLVPDDNKQKIIVSSISS